MFDKGLLAYLLAKFSLGVCNLVTEWILIKLYLPISLAQNKEKLGVKTIEKIGRHETGRSW
jgi:hypothetical protein